MSELFKVDTEQSIAESLGVKHKVFSLVSEDHPVLKKVLPEFDFNNPAVDPNEFASSLVETCKLHRGIGLSANQCGFEHRVFVMGAAEEYVAFFNPKILSYSDEQIHGVEGCLSFPGMFLNLKRSKWINAQWTDENGTEYEAMMEGVPAVVFQHELDHLNGIKMTDNLKPLALKMAKEKQMKFIKKIKRQHKKQYQESLR